MGQTCPRPNVNPLFYREIPQDSDGAMTPRNVPARQRSKTERNIGRCAQLEPSICYPGEENTLADQES